MRKISFVLISLLILNGIVMAGSMPEFIGYQDYENLQKENMELKKHRDVFKKQSESLTIDYIQSLKENEKIKNKLVSHIEDNKCNNIDFIIIGIVSFILGSILF